jgi:hypothetical protein
VNELLGIPVGVLVENSGWPAFFLTCLLVVFGRLVPATTHKRELAREIKRGDDLKEALDATIAAHLVEAHQLAEVLSFVRVARAAAGRKAGSDDEAA